MSIRIEKIVDMFTLKQIRAFQAVVRHGGVAQAARALNASAAAVAANIDNLEAVTGLRLFDRRPARGMALSSDGRLFEEGAQRFIAAADDMAALASSLRQGEQFEIRFGCYHTFAPIFAPALLSTVKSMADGARFMLTEAPRSTLLRALDEGEIDVALIYDLHVDPSQYIAERVIDAMPRAILAKSHPLARRASLSPLDLAPYPYVEFREDEDNSGFTEFLTAANVTPRIALSSRSYEVVRSVVGAGDGYAILAFQPKSMTSYQGDELVAIPFRGRVSAYGVSLVRSRNRQATRTLETFVELCRDVVQRLAQDSLGLPGSSEVK